MPAAWDLQLMGYFRNSSLKHGLLAMKPFLGSHNGENIGGELINAIVDRWRIDQNQIYSSITMALTWWDGVWVALNVVALKNIFSEDETAQRT